MAQHIITSNKFYILSGPSASGKSSFTRQLIEQGMPVDAIVSTDTIRKQILGSTFGSDQYGVKEVLTGWELNQSEIFKIIHQILDIRLKQKLPTIFDATSLNDEDRASYVELAKKHGVDSSIIIFNVPPEELEKRLAHRAERFDFSVVEKQLLKFQKDSQYPHIQATSDDQFILTPLLIPTLNLDVVGDTHGLLSETILLLKKTGWEFKNNTFIHSDSSRKILFLGDIIDRGTQSIELLQAVENTVSSGNGYFLLGNHEAKLISSYEQFMEEGVVRGKSLSSAQTLMDFLKLDYKEQQHLYQFLKNSPTHYCLWINKTSGKPITPQELPLLDNQNIVKIAFLHADNDYFHPYRMTFSHALYGKRRTTAGVDIDLEYQKNVAIGLNDHILIRGHIPNFSPQSHVYSLEADQAFAGYLVNLNVTKYLDLLENHMWHPQFQLFEDSIVKQKSEFHYNDKMQATVELMKELSQLHAQGLISDGWRNEISGKKEPNADGLKIYKYTHKVEAGNLWYTHPLLKKLNGLVLDSAGNIIVQPADKLCHDEKLTSPTSLEKDIIAVEKVDGISVCISKHPFREELLYTTKNSFGHAVIDHIKENIPKTKEKILLDLLTTHKISLMVEVISSSLENNSGIWLIAARELHMDAPLWREDQLDKLANQLEFKRPAWYETTIGYILGLIPTSQLEGFIIRDAVDHEPLIAVKTNYYLATKFIETLESKKIPLLFRKPDKFKENLDQVFYPIVDYLTKNIVEQNFTKMTEIEKLELVRDFIQQGKNVSEKPKDQRILKI